MCLGGAKEVKRKTNINSFKLNKGALRAFLSQKYRGNVA